nr:immunoglobulin light chain junction region [Macaca mulatta]
CQQYDSFPFTS